MVYDLKRQFRMIEKLREYSADLKSMRAATLQEYKQSRPGKYAVERLIFLIIQNILDLLEHNLTGRFKAVSDTNEEIIENAFSRGIISNELFCELKGMGGFRNILAHEYLELNDEIVFEIFVKLPGIAERFIREMEKSG